MNDKLIPLNNASQIVSVYNEVLNDIHTAFALIESAKRKLRNTFGQYNDKIWIGSLSDYSFDHGWEKWVFGDCKRNIKRQAWSYIVDKIQIKSLLSIKRQEELERQLNGDRSGGEDSLPELTEESIFRFINSMLGRAPDMVEEALQEVFEILRPHKQFHNFKTNSEFEIGKRVFFNYWMDTLYTVRLHYNHEKDLRAIDKLFHLLDGKPAAQYPNDVITVINGACQEKKWSAETDYYKLSWYKKGSLHIEFKRPDLVAEINKRAGGMRLKGQQII